MRCIGVTGVQSYALPIYLRTVGVDEGPGRLVEPAVGRKPAPALAGARRPSPPQPADRKSVVQGKRVDLGGRRTIKKTNITIDGVMLSIVKCELKLTIAKL